MANTTNFGWETPDDTDLVKDGAAAMRTLGNAIDASLVDLKGGTTNQILAKNSNTDMDFKWVTNDVGDITAVTAGTGLSGGGTSGDVTLTNTVATTFDAKGDLVVGTGADTFSKLVAGSNGDTLVADSSATTGLRWQGNFAAGKNKIINGDFRINQRAFTSNTTAGSYNFDRWFQDNDGGTVTCTPQTFTLGAAPVAGYEGTTFLRQVTASQSATSHYAQIRHKIESVRTFAGETATLSFWAKAASGTPKIAPLVQQNFGTGGSPSATVNTVASSVTLSTSWARYSVTISVPSISGKTLGTANNDFLGLTFWTSAGSDYNSLTNSLGLQNNTFDIWGVQLESGSVATAFQTATGTLAGELAACQRYYCRFGVGSDSNSAYFGIGSASSTTASFITLKLPVTMRTRPTSMDYASLRITDLVNLFTFTGSTIESNASEKDVVLVGQTGLTGLTQFRTLYLQQASLSGGYIGFSAEL